MLAKWLENGVPIWLVQQTPGASVESPSSVLGAAHLVITFADLYPFATHVQQSAYNSGFSAAAFRAGLGTPNR
jgi:hypothetical protein